MKQLYRILQFFKIGALCYIVLFFLTFISALLVSSLDGGLDSLDVWYAKMSISTIFYMTIILGTVTWFVYIFILEEASHLIFCFIFSLILLGWHISFEIPMVLIETVDYTSSVEGVVFDNTYIFKYALTKENKYKLISLEDNVEVEIIYLCEDRYFDIFNIKYDHVRNNLYGLFCIDGQEIMITSFDYLYINLLKKTN